MGIAIIRKGESAQKVHDEIKASGIHPKGFEADKYSGKLEIREEPSKYQKRVRQEWNESPRSVPRR